MDGADRAADDLTFRVNFSGDGAAKLRERIRYKLKEYMGDYTDDTLVEYVIVLLKNGRRKQEARNELNVFLGDDSYLFVSWLWDHLRSNLDQYVKPEESFPDEAVKAEPVSVQTSRNDHSHLDSELEKEKPSQLSQSRRTKEWTGLVRDADEPALLRSAVTSDVHMEERITRKDGHARPSPSRPVVQRKRNRADGQPKLKRDVVTKATNGAPRRLLQFAVRDAVGTPKPSTLTTEPSLKRLRSVVSTSTGEEPFEDHPQRIRSVARVHNPMAVAMKAVAEAAKDVVRTRPSVNVFDRLGRAMDVAETTNHIAEYRGGSADGVEEYVGFAQVPMETHSAHLQRRGQSVIDDIEIDSDFASDNEAVDVSQSGTSTENKGDNLLMTQYSVANNEDQRAAVGNSSSKVVNISVNVNTWKPPHYQEPREVSVMDSRTIAPETEAGATKADMRQMNEISNAVKVGNEKAIPAADAQSREPQKTFPSTPVLLFPLGNFSDGTLVIYLKQVHFAATKDSLSRHFNKFGEVLKVVIVTDAATGQPKGSAYVEFMRKEAAQHALSQDGNSFMSRILKVVRKSSALQEASPVMVRPHIARGSPYAASRFPGFPYPRGIPSIYRPRLPVKVGARSMQWKRDAQTTPSESGGLPSGKNVPSPSPRSLTYIRTEPKTNGNSGVV
ncbi:hypothetical protein RJ639_004325 [Escallonia herrerae]|uniref:RRM domain-containing protein n=1 Tax=Escallonia herrerae TaxID=1293975 RepID=A0AA88W463_9ASTE|nr:hypothetical protein RJ639_004325 [Escallonia herrerae]